MSIAENLAKVLDQIQVAQKEHPVQLLAVSKTHGVDAIAQAIDAGQRAFGENYVQEAVEKIAYFDQVMPQVKLQWHFIGPLQSNKTRDVARYFDWVESIDREKIARRLSQQRSALKPLKCLVEVNIDEQSSKSGVPVSEVRSLLDTIQSLPNLSLQGLMCIPNPQLPEAERINSLKRMRELFEQLRAEGYPMNVLSMGMSADMTEAIQAGSTQVRVGSGIFGARHYD